MGPPGEEAESAAPPQPASTGPMSTQQTSTQPASPALAPATSFELPVTQTPTPEPQPDPPAPASETAPSPSPSPVVTPPARPRAPRRTPTKAESPPAAPAKPKTTRARPTTRARATSTEAPSEPPIAQPTEGSASAGEPAKPRPTRARSTRAKAASAEVPAEAAPPTELTDVSAEAPPGKPARPKSTRARTARSGATRQPSSTPSAPDVTGSDTPTTEAAPAKVGRARSPRGRARTAPVAAPESSPLPEPAPGPEPARSTGQSGQSGQSDVGTARFVNAAPEPAETRSSPELRPTSSGDLGELIRLLIPDDPTTGPVPIPVPSPDTGPMILPPLDGPFLSVAPDETGPHTVPLAYREPNGHHARNDASDGTATALGSRNADLADRETSPVGGNVTAGPTAAAAATMTAATTAAAATAPTTAPTTADMLADADDVARPAGVEPSMEGFTLVGLLERQRRGRAWARWLWTRLPLPARPSSAAAGRTPSARRWPRALRWSLDMSWERALRRPGRWRWLPAVDWERTVSRPPGRYLLPALDWPPAPRQSPVRRWPTVGRSPARPAWARVDLDRRFAPVYAVAFSPDGRRLATASGDGMVRLWNVANPSAPIRLWEASTRFAAGPVVAFSPDGAWLATGHDTASAVLWEIDERAGPVPRALLAHPGGLTGLHFSADGRRLAGTFAAQAARIWDISDPAQPRPLGRAGDSRLVRAAAIFPDGRWLATAGERVELWEVSATPVRRMHLAAGEGPLFDVAVAPDGRTIAVGRLDGTVDLWHTIDPAAPAPRTSIDAHAGWITSVTFGADSRWLATVSAEQVALWDLRDPTVAVGRMQARLPATAVAFAPERSLLAVASLDGSVALLHPTAPLAPSEQDAPAATRRPADLNGRPMTDTGGEPMADATAELMADADTRPEADADTAPEADADTAPIMRTGVKLPAWKVDTGRPGAVIGQTRDDETAAAFEPLASLGRPAAAPADAGIDLPGRSRRRRRTDSRALAIGLLTVGMSYLLAFGHQLGMPPALLLVAGLLVTFALVVGLGAALAAAVRVPPVGGLAQDRPAGADDGVTRPSGRRSQGAHTRPSGRSRSAGSRAVFGPEARTRGTEPADDRDVGAGSLTATLPLDLASLAGLADVDDVAGLDGDFGPDSADVSEPRRLP